MKLSVDYKDSSGTKSQIAYGMPKIAFLKHLACAGMGKVPSPKILRKFIGVMFHYSDFMQDHEFHQGKFSLPPKVLYDPTEKGHFSTLAGKAIADFLAKRIHSSLFSVNYEAAMKLNGIPIKGGRPDLIAFISPTIAFCIEAKGFTKGPGDMKKHLNQAKAGIIPLNFSAASVSYFLYKKLQCNFYENLIYSNIDVSELYREMSKVYYSNLLKFLDERYFHFEKVFIRNKNFFRIHLVSPYFSSRGDKFKSFLLKIANTLLKKYDPHLLLPTEIFDWADSGIPVGQIPFLYDDEYPFTSSVTRYIHTDWVGLEVNDLEE